MVDVCCSWVHAILLTFDLTNIESLSFIEDSYKNMHKCNETAKYMVVGTKFDLSFNLSDQEKIVITEKAKNFAKHIGAYGIILKNFSKSSLAVFGLTPKIEQIDDQKII